MRTVVLGAGPAGCAAALVLARRGHDVALIDREESFDMSTMSADDIFDSWDRPGVGQFRQPHNFLGRGRAILRDSFPDVYAALLAHGAGELRQDLFLSDVEPHPGDADLATIACRRPLVDAVLRAAVAEQPGITFHAAAVDNVRVAHGVQVTGLELTSGDTIDADLVVDAAGRNSPVPGWLDAVGASWGEQTSDCRLLYYSRHYRFTGDVPPPASLLGGPRGDLGYLAYASFLGDNATFSIAVMAPAWQKEWRELRDVESFDRVARALPGMAPWLDASEPITAVHPMGQLRNTVREICIDGVPSIAGVVPIGDARCHTNPTFAFGLSLSLGHAVALADAVDEASDPTDLVTTYERTIGADAAQRYAAVSDEDRDRVRLWSGEAIDPTDRTDTMALFLRSVVYRVAMQDPAILRAVCRRVSLLDPVGALAADAELLDRAEALFKELPPAPPMPPAATMLATLRGTAA